MDGAARSAARPRRDPGEGRGLRRLPHRSACRRRRIARPALPDHSRPRNCRAHRCDRAGRQRVRSSASASASRGSAIPAGFCPYCRRPPENLCDHPDFHRFTRDGGYATATVADARFAFPLGETGERRRARPLALRRADRLALAGDRRAQRGRIERLGLYGFGAAAHILAQVAIWQGASVFAFTQTRRCRDPGVSPAASARPGPGGSDEAPPEPLDAAIIFAPVGALVRPPCARCARAARWSAPAST